MNYLADLRNFNPHSLRPTQVEIRNKDGSITVTDKYGQLLNADSQRPGEPNFSQYGFIMNPNPDLQIGKINVNGFKILFGSLDAAQDLELLQSNGVTHVINLISNVAPNYFPNAFEYLSLVVYDDLEFQLRDSVYECLDFIRRVRNARGCCFIHCHAGICRAPAIVMAYLIRVEDYSYEQAYSEVNNARNVTINLNFKTQLMAMAF